MDSKDKQAQQILETALLLAEKKSSWEAVRLCEVAAELNISLYQISAHYRQKDDLAEAWFDRADRAMLEDADRADYLQLPVRDRFHRSIMTWLNAMSEHRRVTGQMLLYKLEFGHVHLQALGVMRISRTVQWILEAAHRKTLDFERVLEEVVLTGIFLSAFAFWLSDSSSDAMRTSKFLETSLERIEKLSYFKHVIWPFRIFQTGWGRQNEAKVEMLHRTSRI